MQHLFSRCLPTNHSRPSRIKPDSLTHSNDSQSPRTDTQEISTHLRSGYRGEGKILAISSSEARSFVTDVVRTEHRSTSMSVLSTLPAPQHCPPGPAYANQSAMPRAPTDCDAE